MKKITLNQLKQMAQNAKWNLWEQARNLDRDVKIYLHWTAGHYGQFFDDYHINIDVDGSIYVSTDDLAQIKSHTYRRNTGSIGITLTCACNATSNDLGQEPPTLPQIECMAQVVAVLCEVLDLTVDINRVMTHAEAADNMDGLNPGYESNGYPQGKYGPANGCERWDLARLVDSDDWMSGGDTIRGKAIWYQCNK